MNQICFNNAFFDEAAFQVHANDRAFKYGDGLFETIIHNGVEIKFWEDHLSRLQDGIHILGMYEKSNFADELKHNIEQLIHLNKHQSGARIRLQVWRKEGGLYSPSDFGINYILQSFALIDNPLKTIKIGFCSKIQLAFSSISHLKTCNALPYIIASIEKQELGLDDLILFDADGNISEATSANVFWLKEGVWFTPSLKTGCIAGVMRLNVIRQLKSMLVEVREVEEDAKKLINANGILLTNVTGIRIIGELENRVFDPNHIQTVVDKLLFSLSIKFKNQ